MIRSRAQLTEGPETRRLMREVFEQNEPTEDAILMRMARVRERRRLVQGEVRVRNRYAFAGAVAALCVCGTALGVGVGTGLVAVEFFPARAEQKSSAKEAAAVPEVERSGRTPAQAHRLPNSPERVEVSREALTPSKARYFEPAPSRILPPSTKDAPASAFTSKEAQAGGEVAQLPHDSPSTSAASWQEVAGAMRAGDDARAREAITPLTESSDRETRDSAELVRLRIELGSHREGKLAADASQRARLERLAKDGASPSIRTSARRLLARVNPIGVRDFSEIDDAPR